LFADGFVESCKCLERKAGVVVRGRVFFFVVVVVVI
jgi:hypothetical protein